MRPHDPTSYFWVHLTLAVTSFLLGTAVGLIGLRSVLALRRSSRTERAERADRTDRPDQGTSA